MATLADGNRVTLAYIAETVWGSTPASNVDMSAVRLTGESLGHTKQTTTSNEIRSDRQRADIVEVGANAGGDVSFELSHTAFDDFLEALLQGTWVTGTFNGTPVTFTNASTVTFTTAITGQLTAGQWVKIGGDASNHGNDGVFRIKSLSASSATAQLDGDTITTEATTVTSTNVTWKTLANGVTQRSFTLQRSYGDINRFFVVTGARVNTMSLSINSNAIVTGSFGFLAKEGSFASTTAASVVTDAASNDVLNSTANVGSIFEGEYDSVLTTAIQSVSLNVTNNMRQQSVVGSRTGIGVGTGSFEVTGSITAYFDDIALANKFVNHTATSLSLRFTDASGNALVLTFPKVYFESGNAPAGGINTDVVLNLGFRVARDATQDITMRVDSV